MALVNLPDSALGSEASIGCQLSKSSTCKKIEKMTEPKKEQTILPGKTKANDKTKQNSDKKKKEDVAKKEKEAADKKKEAANKKKEAADKKKKKPTGACNIGLACKSGQN